MRQVLFISRFGDNPRTLHVVRNITDEEWRKLRGKLLDHGMIKATARLGDYVVSFGGIGPDAAPLPLDVKVWEPPKKGGGHE